MKKRNSGKMRKTRYEELKRILEQRQLEIIWEVQQKMRDVRSERAATIGRGVRDEVESSEAETQDDIEFALLQMKAEMLYKIGQALWQLEAGDYGYCYECGKEIAELRLRALPFAVRCKVCEEECEVSQNHDKAIQGVRVGGMLFAETIS